MQPDHLNLSSYEGFELLENFSGNLNAYREKKISGAGGHVEYIKKQFPEKKIRVLELGSGNSKMLYALELAGVLEKGYGVEISRSRHEFAEKWRVDAGFRNVENVCANALDIDYGRFGKIDLCLCVDLAFQFFEPIEKGSALRILKEIYSILVNGGKIILELDGCDRILRRLEDGSARIWEEFAEPDPWRYSLWDCSYDAAEKFLTWKKTFIKRSEYGFSENTQILRIYRKEEIGNLIKQAGFSNIGYCSDWTGAGYIDDTSEYIVVGQK